MKRGSTGPAIKLVILNVETHEQGTDSEKENIR